MRLITRPTHTRALFKPSVVRVINIVGFIIGGVRLEVDNSIETLRCCRVVLMQFALHRVLPESDRISFHYFTLISQFQEVMDFIKQKIGEQ